MQAINYYVVIDKIKDAPKKVGGLEITEKQDSDVRYLRGLVVSVGDKVEAIKEGSIIRYDKHAGHGIEWKEELFYVIKVGDIVLVE
jgi:co-chaperonin GroES (HSP10)